MNKSIIISLFFLGIILCTGCVTVSQSAVSTPATYSPHTNTTTIYTTVTSTPPSTTPVIAPTSFTGQWAEGLVAAYLENLAASPEAIRYLAQLGSECYVTARYDGEAAGEMYLDHEYSGWQVYLKLISDTRPSKPQWDNLNWSVFTDGFVAEGSTDALEVKADLIELSQ